MVSIKDISSLTVPHYCMLYLFAIYFMLVTSNSTYNPIQVITIFLSLSFTLMGLNVLNMIFDKDLDKINKPTRPLPAGRITIKFATLFSIILILFGLILSNYNFYLLISNFILIFFFLLYTHPKIYLKRYTISSPLFGMLFYSIVPLISIIEILNFEITAFIIFYILGILAISSLKDIEDTKGEEIKKIKSIPIIIGKENTINLSIVILLFSNFIILFLIILNIIDMNFIFGTTVIFFIIYIMRKDLIKSKIGKNITTQSKIVSKSFLYLIIFLLIYTINSVILYFF